MTFLRHDEEELSQSEAQLPHVPGVCAAAVSKALHQGDIGPDLVHHTRILAARAAISVGRRDLQLRLSDKMPHTLSVRSSGRPDRSEQSVETNIRQKSVFF